MHARRMGVAVVALCALFVSVWVLPAAAASEGPREPARPLAEIAVSASHVDWQPTVEYERVVLTVAGPGDLLIRRELDAGQTPSLTLSAGAGDLLPDGMYTYELRFVQGTGKPSGQPLVLSGYLSVRDGSFVKIAPEKSEAATHSGPAGIAQITAEDEVVPDDLIVQGYVCIGFECEEGDGGGSIRFKDAATGLFFDDVPDSFSPTHDWSLKVNDSFFEGSGEYFSILDVDTVLRPFTVEGDAPANALYVRANGNLGLGTSTPAQDIHAMSGNTPTLRLDQDTSGSLSARTWDLGANHTELFVKDVTNSSSVPFRIKAGAPSDSLVVASGGNVGIGTSSPARPLEVARSGAVEIGLFNSSTVHAGGGPATPATWFFQVDNDANKTLKISRVGTGGAEITVDRRLDANGATLTVDGSVQATNVVFSSSRSLKEDIRPLDPQEVLARVAHLPIAEWRFKEGPQAVRHIGPMAEDFHDAFGLNPNRETISVTDTSGVALAAIQALLQRVRELEKTNSELTERLQNMGTLDERLANLERALDASQQRP